MSARKREVPEPAEPRTDAPEHPLDPADAAFLDPAAVVHRAAPAPAASRGEDAPPAGFGDYEGERPEATDGDDADRGHATRRRVR